MAIHPLVDVPVTAFSQDPRGFAFWFNQQDWLGGDALYITLARFCRWTQPSLEAYEPFSSGPPIEPLYHAFLWNGGAK